VYRPMAAAVQALASPALGQGLGLAALRSRGGMFANAYDVSSCSRLTSISGTTVDHCNTGCQAGYGQCKTSSTPATKVSKDGRCGPQHGGQTCAGSAFGDCCSQYR
jgi:hypothetical protein